jgi:hypothetical protein
MSEVSEKRGPIEKGQKGWPINPLGVVALIIFGLIIAFLIVKPLLQQKAPAVIQEQTSSDGGRIVSPQSGEIIKGEVLPIELSIDNPSKVQKVQFWAKTYADGKWQMIGEVESPPYKLDWQIPSEFQNRAVALTSHIYQKDGNVIKDPGGWREGIIILSK